MTKIEEFFEVTNKKELEMIDKTHPAFSVNLRLFIEEVVTDERARITNKMENLVWHDGNHHVNTTIAKILEKL